MIQNKKIESLYLWCSNELVSFYTLHGYTILHEKVPYYNNRIVNVMQKNYLVPDGLPAVC